MEGVGFRGFVSVRRLRTTDASAIPDEPGVYAVFRHSKAEPIFLATSGAGRFKRRDPTIPNKVLALKWVPGAPVVYLGKAGSPSGSQTLRKRIRDYLSFGSGKPKAHWGGRAIWQLADSDELLFAWKVTKALAARREEKQLIEAFRARYAVLPFANWRL